MTIDGYKSCRKLREQVLSTELNIRYRNTKYSSLLLTAPVAEWLAYFPLIRTSRARAALGVINKLTERSLKCACHSVD